jgi:hypothetical protein
MGVRPPPPTGYLGDVWFFKWELLSCLTDDDDNDDGDEEEDDDDEEGKDDEEEGGDNDHGDENFNNGGVARDPEYQPTDLNEDEAIQLAIAQSELGQLGQWDGLVVQLRESALAKGRPEMPERESRGLSCTPPVAWDPWPELAVLATLPPPPPASVNRLPLLVPDWP